MNKRKIYKAPKIRSEKVKIGVFGNCNNARDDGYTWHPSKDHAIFGFCG